jgi:uroporphyrinogen decarboxylase
MGLKELKRDFGDVLTFWGGGVDTQSTLNNGSPQQVADEVKRIIDIMAPGGGFIFAAVHNIQEDVSPENFWAMWDTLMEYGVLIFITLLLIIRRCCYDCIPKAAYYGVSFRF